MDVHSSLIRGVRVSHLPGIALKAIHIRPFGEINLSLYLSSTLGQSCIVPIKAYHEWNGAIEKTHKKVSSSDARKRPEST